jgi:hypothetical protein
MPKKLRKTNINSVTTVRTTLVGVDNTPPFGQE